MARIVGLDFGSKRIGVAVSDELGVLATPHGVLQRRSYNKDAAWISELVSEMKAEGVVLGSPVGLSGNPTEQTRRAQQFGEMLATRVPVPVGWWDERLTTVVARRISLQSRGAARTPRRAALSRHEGLTRGPEGLDAIAAAIILQGYLDHRRRLADSDARLAGSGEAGEPLAS